MKENPTFHSEGHESPEAQIPFSELENEIAMCSLEEPRDSATRSLASNLSIIMKTQEEIRARKRQPISFSKPIILRDEVPIIFPNTINLIQGQAGVHKSRFAELFCSVLLRTMGCTNELLGFKANRSLSFTTVYVDTERNQTEQFPFALQQIQLQAGFNIEDDPNNFDFISLLDIARPERFMTLEAYLKKVRKEHDNHLFIVLDVVTDCIENFNNPEHSMKLIDLLNIAINKYNVTFLCIIHENPGIGNKARGHLGTELMNKSSSVMQVAFEQNGDSSDSNIIRLKFLKCRSTERPRPIYVRYDKESRQLIEAGDDELREIQSKRKTKAVLGDVIDVIEETIKFPITKKQLVCDLCKWLHTSDKTIIERIEELIESKHVFYKDEKPFVLVRGDKNGRNVMFNLKPLDGNE